MLNITQLRLSHSSLQTFRSCARKLEFRKFHPTMTKDESLAGEVGHCLHVGYQHYLVHKDRDAAIFAMIQRYPIHLNSNPSNSRSIEACYPTLNAIIDSGAFLEYEIAEIKCLDGEVRKAIEVPFQIDIKGFDLGFTPEGEPILIIYVGWIDAILYDKILDEYLVIDIKTTQWHLNDMTPVYHFDEQCIPYGIVLERILGRSLDTLTVKYLSVYIDIEKPKITPYEFKKTRIDIEDWARGLLVDLQMIKMYYQMGWFKRTPSACVTFNKVCQHFDICNQRDQTAIARHLTLDQTPYVEEEIIPWIKLEMELAA